MDGDALPCRFARLDRAVRRRDDLERLLAADPADDLLRAQSLAACEHVLHRRAELYRCLIRQGWVAPRRVLHAVLVDELLLDEPADAAGG